MKPNALVVDGSITVRMDLRAALASAGFVVTACESKACAQNLLRRGRFSLVVVDVVLADGDGMDLLDEIRKAPELAALPVIMLCSEAEAKHRFEGTKSGADAYIPKPYDHAALTRRARELAARPAPPARESNQPQAGLKRILAVDDSPTYLDTLMQALSLDGFDVIPARSAEEALERLRLEHVDCVLMDLVMPGMGGMEGARRIKSEPAWQHIPVIILTGQDEESARRQGATIGVDDFVIKSPEPALLKVHLRAVFRKRGIERGRAPEEPADGARSERGQARSQPESLFGRVLAASGLSGVIGPTTIRRACERVGVDPQAMTQAELVRALPAIQDSIRVFLTVEEHQRRAAMLAGVVAELVTAPAAPADRRRP